MSGAVEADPVQPCKQKKRAFAGGQFFCKQTVLWYPGTQTDFRPRYQPLFQKASQQADPGGSGDFADSGLSAFVSGQRAGFRRSKRSGGTDQKDEGGKRVRLCQRGAAKLFAG